MASYGCVLKVSDVRQSDGIVQDGFGLSSACCEDDKAASVTCWVGKLILGLIACTIMTHQKTVPLGRKRVSIQITVFVKWRARAALSSAKDLMSFLISSHLRYNHRAWKGQAENYTAFSVWEEQMKDLPHSWQSLYSEVCVWDRSIHWLRRQGSPGGSLMDSGYAWKHTHTFFFSLFQNLQQRRQLSPECPVPTV